MVLAMSADLSRSNSLTDLAARIAEAHAHVARAMQTGLANAKIANELLIEAKQTVPHGQWEDWVHSNCQFSGRTAQVYMRIARLAPAKAQRVADLSLREATKALARPKTLMLPPPSIDERIDIESYDFGMPLHPACMSSGMASPDELADMADSIKASGLLYPLTLYKDGSLLDGKDRLVACRIAGVEPRFETLPDDIDPRKFVISKHLRVSLTPSQRAVARAKLHLLYSDTPINYHADRHLFEMAVEVLQYAPGYFEPLRDGGLHLAEVYEQVRAERDEADRQAQMFADLRAEAPDLAELVTAGRVPLAGAVAAADERRERAYRAQMFDASADLLKALAED